ncbi:DUF1799 domain-containing protein [Leptospira sp. 96542]|nr:DUF1799 domain-containing protein [Leptospira sp. 96542]
MDAVTDGEPRKKLKRVARALVCGGANEVEGALAAFGMKPEGLDEDEEDDCYPDNWLPVLVFQAMATQWVVDKGWRVGMRYEALPIVMDVHKVPQEQRADVFWALARLEATALEILNKRK